MHAMCGSDSTGQITTWIIVYARTVNPIIVEHYSDMRCRAVS